jgi:hypothetical protein
MEKIKFFEQSNKKKVEKRGQKNQIKKPNKLYKNRKKPNKTKKTKLKQENKKKGKKKHKKTNNSKLYMQISPPKK